MTLPVSFGLDMRTLTAGQKQTLLDEVFGAACPAGVDLGSLRGNGGLRVLTASDRGTTGLVGPVRADTPAGGAAEERFVKLVFNVGQPSTRHMSGGTYGFGKTITYVVSSVSAVVIRSRIAGERGPEDRLVAVGIGDGYEEGRRRFTGRHWWGRMRDDRIGPVTGRDAVRLGRLLGMPAFEDGETGTDIVVVAPDLGQLGTGDDGEARTPADAGRLMADTVRWYFWPKMTPVSRRGRPPMQFSVTVDGAEVPLRWRAPSPLSAYASAIDAIRRQEAGRGPDDGDPVELHEVRMERPVLHLGWLALVPLLGLTDRSASHAEQLGIGTAPVVGPPHHVARMRQSELVVDYLDGPRAPVPGTGWVGVFKAAPETDDAFAEAEPPTHDGWNPQLVADRRQKSVVVVSRRRIGEILDGLFRSAGSDTPAGVDGAAVIIADALAGLLRVEGNAPGASPVPPPAGGGDVPGSSPNGTGTDEGGATGTRRGGRTSGRPACVVGIGDSELSVTDDGRLETWVKFSVETAGAVSLLAEAAVAVEDGASLEREPPAGAEPVEVLGFESDSGAVTVEGPLLNLQEGDETRWWVRCPRSV